MNKFKEETLSRIEENRKNSALTDAAKLFMLESTVPKYSYNFLAQGVPIIQYPQDIIAMQEIIWSVKPDLIIETGIAHGGSLIWSASMLALLDINEAIQKGESLNPNKSKRKVLGIDIDIRSHNKELIESHPMISRIQMIEGPSTDPAIIQLVKKISIDYKKILVCLDSNHTHNHVYSELEAYAPLTSVDSYCVVFDTIIEDLPNNIYPDRPWDPGNNPKTAVKQFLEDNTEFEIDKNIQNKLLITVSPDGYLKRVR
ncbi:cephalosporin hydroxylase family protein [Candidatus Pelagibacter sp.]|nr:cephalosporin hydroxylase family protein [Candidatus Pelagibacter sp.]|tara:strand:- start:287 stop:1057 length:771 start_codon:yes stop_codon:yes gene_type:complete